MRGAPDPYANVYAYVLAFLDAYANDHAAFQLGLRLYPFRICMQVCPMLCQQHSLDKVGAVEHIM